MLFYFLMNTLLKINVRLQLLLQLVLYLKIQVDVYVWIIMQIKLQQLMHTQQKPARFHARQNLISLCPLKLKNAGAFVLSGFKPEKSRFNLSICPWISTSVIRYGLGITIWKTTGIVTMACKRVVLFSDAGLGVGIILGSGLFCRSLSILCMVPHLVSTSFFMPFCAANCCIPAIQKTTVNTREVYFFKAVTFRIKNGT